MVRNVIIVSLGVLTWWILGYAFSFGHPTDFIGERYYAGNYWEGEHDYTMALAYGFICMYILLLVKGVHVERGGFIPQLIFTFMVTWFVWPVVVAWGWGGAWLQGYFDEPFLDAGGAATIHLFAGVLAMTASLLGRRPEWLVSERQGTLATDFKPLSYTLIMTGGLLEMIAIVYINALYSKTLILSGTAFFNTWLAGGAAGLTAYLFATAGSKCQTDYVLSLVKGTVAGMVIVSSFGQNVAPWEAFVHGFTGGVLYVIAKKIEDKVKVDDPLRVIPAHFLPGVFGCVGAAFWHDDQGVYHQNVSGAQIGYQLAGVVCIMVWTAIWGLILFGVFKAFEPKPKKENDPIDQEQDPLANREEQPKQEEVLMPNEPGVMPS